MGGVEDMDKMLYKAKFMITVEHLTKCYGDFIAVRDLS